MFGVFTFKGIVHGELVIQDLRVCHINMSDMALSIGLGLCEGRGHCDRSTNPRRLYREENSRLKIGQDGQQVYDALVLCDLRHKVWGCLGKLILIYEPHSLRQRDLHEIGDESRNLPFTKTRSALLERFDSDLEKSIQWTPDACQLSHCSKDKCMLVATTLRKARLSLIGPPQHRELSVLELTPGNDTNAVRAARAVRAGIVGSTTRSGGSCPSWDKCRRVSGT